MDYFSIANDYYFLPRLCRELLKIRIVNDFWHAKLIAYDVEFLRFSVDV